MMRRLRFTSQMLRGYLGLGIFLLAAPVLATQTTFNPGGDDTTFSMGQIIVWVQPQFRPMVLNLASMRSDVCFGNVSHELTSPVLFDQNTIIGRSVAHVQGDASDTGGTSVGTLFPLTVADSNIALFPSGMQTPGEREVHTKLTRLVLEDWQQQIRVRAGNHPDANPGGNQIPAIRQLSPGEVESKPGNGPDFPAESFFDVFVEVDLPVIGTLYNSAPLLVIHDPITEFPPTVVYIHGETPAVAVYRKSDNALFGYLRLAGHGMAFPCCNTQPGTMCRPADCAGSPPDPACTSSTQFLQEMANAPRLPCPQCVDGPVPAFETTGLVVLLLALITIGTLVIVRRRQRPTTT